MNEIDWDELDRIAEMAEKRSMATSTITSTSNNTGNSVAQSYPQAPPKTHVTQPQQFKSFSPSRPSFTYQQQVRTPANYVQTNKSIGARPIAPTPPRNPYAPINKHVEQQPTSKDSRIQTSLSKYGFVQQHQQPQQQQQQQQSNFLPLHQQKQGAAPFALEKANTFNSHANQQSNSHHQQQPSQHNQQQQIMKVNPITKPPMQNQSRVVQSSIPTSSSSQSQVKDMSNELLDDDDHDDYMKSAVYAPTVSSIKGREVDRLTRTALQPDYLTLDTFIYPQSDDYPVRKYQRSIIEKCFHHNTLVVLPTGLGKTFIAAVVMANYLRWFPHGKVIFLAPTRPLVTQQIQACHDISGIQEEETAELMGHVKPSVRKNLWKEKRVFYCTPQTAMSDIKSKIFPINEVVLVVIDEAHRATGGYAYVEVVQHMRENSPDFRVLALSATPGRDYEKVQEVVQNLLISRIEYKSESDFDVREYIFRKMMEIVEVKLNSTTMKVIDEFNKFCVEPLRRLKETGLFPTLSTDVRKLTPFLVLMAIKEVRRAKLSAEGNNKLFLVTPDAYLLQGLLQARSLLIAHGLEAMRGQLLRSFGDGNDLSRSRRFLTDKPEWRQFLRYLDECINAGDSNPKVSKLIEVIVDHFGRFKIAGKQTSVIVFTQFRDSVAEICDAIASKTPYRVSPFIGQSSSKTSSSRSSSNHEEEGEDHYFNNEESDIYGEINDEDPDNERSLGQSGAQSSSKKSAPKNGKKSKNGNDILIGKEDGKSNQAEAIMKGQSQKEQQEIVKRFRNGEIDVLVATCIGEEGLDIGSVDLIVSFDAVSSPVRMIQRFGRAGRKRSGAIVVLVSEGKEKEYLTHGTAKSRQIHNLLRNNQSKIKMYDANPIMLPSGCIPKLKFEKINVAEYRSSQVGGRTQKRRRNKDESEQMKKKKSRIYQLQPFSSLESKRYFEILKPELEDHEQRKLLLPNLGMLDPINISINANEAWEMRFDHFIHKVSSSHLAQLLTSSTNMLFDNSSSKLSSSASECGSIQTPPKKKEGKDDEEIHGNDSKKTCLFDESLLYIPVFNEEPQDTKPQERLLSVESVSCKMQMGSKTKKEEEEEEVLIIDDTKMAIELERPMLIIHDVKMQEIHKEEENLKDANEDSCDTNNEDDEDDDLVPSPPKAIPKEPDAPPPSTSKVSTNPHSILKTSRETPVKQREIECDTPLSNSNQKRVTFNSLKKKDESPLISDSWLLSQNGDDSKSKLLTRLVKGGKPTKNEKKKSSDHTFKIPTTTPILPKNKNSKDGNAKAKIFFEDEASVSSDEINSSDEESNESDKDLSGFIVHSSQASHISGESPASDGLHQRVMRTMGSPDDIPFLKRASCPALQNLRAITRTEWVNDSSDSAEVTIQSDCPKLPESQDDWENWREIHPVPLENSVGKYVLVYWIDDQDKSGSQRKERGRSQMDEIDDDEYESINSQSQYSQEDDGTYYLAQVLKYNSTSKKHLVHYIHSKERAWHDFAGGHQHLWYTKNLQNQPSNPQVPYPKIVTSAAFNKTIIISPTPSTINKPSVSDEEMKRRIEENKKKALLLRAQRQAKMNLSQDSIVFE